MSFVKKIKPKILVDYFKVINSHSRIVSRTFCVNDTEITTPSKKGGFAQAFDKYTAPQLDEKPEDNQTFASLLKNSKFIDLGDSEGKIVIGKIFHIVGDDLYIDFGWKFNCICQRPTKLGSEYVRGSKVRLRIKDLELSTKFLGSSKDLTILEADCQLIGLVSSSIKSNVKI